MNFVDSLNFEFGYRDSDYNSIGSVDTWKIGLNWRINDQFLLLAMEQEASRAPNASELFSPISTGLDIATQDPCSIGNVGNINSTLQARCVSTGKLPAQVGVLQDIISGQINILQGSSLTNPPATETADTFTARFVWTPNVSFVDNLSISLDYYDIDITDVIGEFSAQEILDQCYVAGIAAACANVKRVDDDLTALSSGIQLFTTNLAFEGAEGYELAARFGVDLDNYGDLEFSTYINKYKTQESQSSSLTPVIDYKGYYGTTCVPVSVFRFVQRTTWSWGDLTASLQWRHIDAVDIEPTESAGTFAAFRGIDNLTDEEPPVVGNEAADTSSNSGNTFPSNYELLGRAYTFGARLIF